MNYDSIILEMLSRIQVLEEQVRALEGRLPGAEADPAPASPPAAPAAAARVTTGDVRAHIRGLLRRAAAEGRETLVLRAGDLQRTLGLSNRAPLVCNAMRQCMGEGDHILHQTPSGNSTTLEIRYGTAPYAAEDRDD